MKNKLTVLVPICLFLSCSTNSPKDNKAVLDTLKNGNVVILGVLDGDKKVGLWNTYDEITGRLMATECYKNNLLEGPYIFYSEDGTVFDVGQFKDSLRTGVWQSYYSYPNKLASKGMFVKDKKVGIWEHFDLRGGIELKVEYGQNEEEKILIDNRMPVPPNPE